jgi:retron-type reverse transcriptase
MDHLTKYNILSPTQYAFRPHSSTTLVLQTIINNIHNQKHRKFLDIYVDLSKAYDTVSHTKLIKNSKMISISHQVR